MLCLINQFRLLYTVLG